MIFVSTMNKEQIKQYMLKLIDAGDENLVPKTMENFGVSKSTIYNYLKKMCEEGIIEKKDGARGTYRMVTKTFTYVYANDGTLGEDRIFNKDIAQHFKGLENNVYSAWRYAFTEMMNNAIEHSGGKEIIVAVQVNDAKSSVLLFDNGIGIFRNIQEYMKNQMGEDLPLDECVSLLFAGKFTTAAHAHSGEGIFFTSHLMDRFLILSDEIFFSRNNFSDLLSDMKLSDAFNSLKLCTVVYMELGNHSKKTTREVFDRFSDVEQGFIRTQIPIAHFFPNGNPVSRSEARRLGEMILKFKEITLDFANVDEVGQAFVHELFVVWQGRNLDVTLKYIHTEQGVENMIRRVLNTK